MKVSNINKSYNAKRVVKDISFNLPVGKITSFIGPNGAGKSTVLNIITRLINKDSGEVSLEDLDITKYKSNELAKKLAILTQSNNIQMNITVKDLVCFGRFPHSGNNLNEEDLKKVNEAINYMELDEYKDRFINQLSGGQLQRAYIAMVIAQDTEFIFLDEPTNNLDIYHSSNLMKMVRKLCDELGKTVILVLHDINFASVYSDYIGAFKGGHLYKLGSVDEIMTKEVLKDLYRVDFDIKVINDKKIAIYY